MPKELPDDGQGGSSRRRVRRRRRNDQHTITTIRCCWSSLSSLLTVRQISPSSKKCLALWILYVTCMNIGLLFSTFGDATAADSAEVRTDDTQSTSKPKPNNMKPSNVRRVTVTDHRQQQQQQHQYSKLENEPDHQHQHQHLRTTAAASSASPHSKYNHSLPVASLESPLFARAGTHHATIFAGHPPVAQHLIVDTGSRLTAWLCRDRQPQQPQRQQQQQRSSRNTTTTTTTLRDRYDPAHSTTARPSSCRQGCVFQDASKCGAVHNNNDDDNNDRCIVRQRYTEGSSWTAYEVSDIVSLPTATTQPDYNDDDGGGSSSHSHSHEKASLPATTAVPFTFGCQTRVTGLFRKQFADGILGLERHSDSHRGGSSSPPLLPRALHRHGVTRNSAFALCLGRAAGSLGWGGAQLHRHLEPMRWTPLRESSVVHKHNNNNNKTGTGMYSVTVEEVWLGDTCLASRHFHWHEDDILDAFHSGSGTILDSGTTDTYLPQAVAKALQTAWLEQTGRPLSLSQQTPPHHRSRSATTYTRQQFDRLPALRLVLAGGVNLTVPAANYMEGASVFFQHDNNNNQQQQQRSLSTSSNSTTREYVLKNRLYADQPAGSGAVLGINAMVGYDILYDAARGLIGLARANCEETSHQQSTISR